MQARQRYSELIAVCRDIEQALATFLNTLSSPRTRKAYERAISLRPTMAVETLRAGAGPVIVQRLLGHTSLSTTQRYVDHLEREDLSRWAFSPV
jgi:site-specific recombinase XerD